MQLQITDFSRNHEQIYTLSEYNTTAAQFPPRIPLPAVDRLPAEFECPICFQVKNFQEPSHWMKHVYEDVHPFTCSCPRRNEIKSFKQMANWVRHENERHRQLEWWTCPYLDCTHMIQNPWPAPWSLTGRSADPKDRYI